MFLMLFFSMSFLGLNNGVLRKSNQKGMYNLYTIFFFTDMITFCWISMIPSYYNLNFHLQPYKCVGSKMGFHCPTSTYSRDGTTIWTSLGLLKIHIFFQRWYMYMPNCLPPWLVQADSCFEVGKAHILEQSGYNFICNFPTKAWSEQRREDSSSQVVCKVQQVSRPVNVEVQA